MTAAAKTRVVHGALVVFALWPLVHLGLVCRYDVSPWKLGGWGMYTVPRFGLIGMEIHGRPARTAGSTPPTGDGDEGWAQLTAPSPELQRIATAFLERHRWLRRLASADELAARVFAEHPDWVELRATVSYPAIDPDSGRVAMRTDERRLEVARAASDG